ncbi:MAG: hypothetical protein ACP5R2_05055 [Anaerolineae bacterium]
MEADKDKTNVEPNETRSSRLTCADCAVDIDKLLAEEDNETSANKGSHLVFDVSRLGAGTLNSVSETSENVTHGAEQGQD